MQQASGHSAARRRGERDLHPSKPTRLCGCAIVEVPSQSRAGIYRDFQFKMRIIRGIIRCRSIMHCIWSIIPQLALPAKKGIYSIYTPYISAYTTPVIQQ